MGMLNFLGGVALFLGGLFIVFFGAFLNGPLRPIVMILGGAMALGGLYKTQQREVVVKHSRRRRR